MGSTQTAEHRHIYFAVLSEHICILRTAAKLNAAFVNPAIAKPLEKDARDNQVVDATVFQNGSRSWNSIENARPISV